MDKRSESCKVARRAVKLLKENNARVRFLTPDEEAALFAELEPADQAVVLVALHTGLRQAEQFRLRWECVDLANRVLMVPRSKSGDARRVPMNDGVLETLRVLPSRLKSPWVFPSAVGETPLDARNFYNRVFVPALERAGIEGFHWHDLRHTFASRLVMAGVDLRTVQELMGHKTQAMTLRYSHLSSQHQLDAVQRLTSTPTGTTTGTPPKVVELTTKPPKGFEPSTCRLRIGCSTI
jgi:integrase